MQYATCRTPGCGNEGHTVPLDFISEPVDAVLCGACGATITELEGDDA